MSQQAARRLRPYLFTGFRRARVGQSKRVLSQTACRQDGAPGRDVTHDYAKRVAQIETQRPLETWYPRLPASIAESRSSLSVVRRRAVSLKRGETEDSIPIIVTGIKASHHSRLSMADRLQAGYIRSVQQVRG